jgi:hypothetical protein
MLTMCFGQALADSARPAGESLRHLQWYSPSFNDFEIPARKTTPRAAPSVHRFITPNHDLHPKKRSAWHCCGAGGEIAGRCHAENQILLHHARCVLTTGVLRKQTHANKLKNELMIMFLCLSHRAEQSSTALPPNPRWMSSRARSRAAWSRARHRSTTKASSSAKPGSTKMPNTSFARPSSATDDTCRPSLASGPCFANAAENAKARCSCKRHQAFWQPRYLVCVIAETKSRGLCCMYLRDCSGLPAG